MAQMMRAVMMTVVLTSSTLTSSTSAQSAQSVQSAASPSEPVVVFDASRQEASAVGSRGTFGWDGKTGLAVTTRPGWGDAVLLSSMLVAHDVEARLTVLPGRSPDVGLIVRGNADRIGRGAAPTAAPSASILGSADALDELDGGYVAWLSRGRLRLVRFEHRIPRVLCADARFKTLDPTTPVTIRLAARGDVVEASVVAGSGTVLGHVKAVDRGFVVGAVGLTLGRRDDSQPLRLEATRFDDERPGAVDVTSLTNPDLTMDGEGTGAGLERLITIAAVDVPKLPRSLRRRVISDGGDVGDVGDVGKDSDVDEAILTTDADGVDAIRHAGVAIRRHRTQMPFKYRDRSVRNALGKPVPRQKGRPVIDASYKDAAMVAATVRAFHEAWPELTRVEVIGRSTEGREILALLISKNAAVDEVEPAVLLDGAHHGGELISTEVVLDAMAQLLEGYGKDAGLTRMVDGLAIWCVPLVNVDGNHRYIHETRDYDRKNARDIDNNGRLDGWDGVDLYRQYPVKWGELGEIGSRSWPFHYRYRGPSAGSEPEIQAMMALAEREHFAASVDFHTYATKILVPYTDPSLENPASNEAWSIAESIAKDLPKQVSGRPYQVQRNLYPVDGTAQDWFRFRFGTVALLVEAPQHNPLPYQPARDRNVIPTRGTWQKLLAAVVDGPSVRVRVQDAGGAPVPDAGVAVVVEAHAPVNGERWTVRGRDGLAVRLLPSPGSAVVVVSDGEQTVRREVKVGRGAVDVVVNWPPAP